MTTTQQWDDALALEDPLALAGTPFPAGSPVTAGGGYYLAAPQPHDRRTTAACVLPTVRTPLREVDENRLALNSSLIAAGIPPMPGDRDALNVLAGLDAATVRTLISWITAARQAVSAAAVS